MRYNKVMQRRTWLRGAGGVTLLLPFLEEMQATSLWAARPDPPGRAFNVFFGLGYPRLFQAEGFSRDKLLPLEPLLDDFQDRLLVLRGVNQTIADGQGNSHYDGSSAAFTGTPFDTINTSKDVTGGMSMDQALRTYLHPETMPQGVKKAVNTGTWWRFSDSSARYIHSRGADGRAVDGERNPPQTPRELFQLLFGNAPAPTPMTPDGMVDEAAARRQAMRTSILDAVTDQYDHLTGPRGGLGQSSRQTVKSYLDNVRDLEQQVLMAGSMKDPAATPMGCTSPAQPADDAYPHTNPGDAGGLDLSVEKLSAEFQLMAQLFATGVRCDRVRFGSVIFQSGGERIRVKGKYDYKGREVANFDDSGVLNAGGEKGCSHEFWHGFGNANNQEWARKHLHFMMSQVSYFLKQLDAIPDSNDKTVFDNAMITIATESGDGRHGSAKEELDSVLHMINAANGRFKVGGDDMVDVNADGIDLYNTMLAAHDVPKEQRLWDGRGDLGTLIRA